MIHIALCDDDREAIDFIAALVEKCCKEKQVIWECRKFQKGEMLLYEIEEGRRFDILLLDVDMPGLGGMELAGRLRVFLPEALVIFITSHRKYVYQSFKVRPYRYLLKQRVLDELPQALSAALEEAVGQEDSFYIVENSKILEKIPIRQINYIEHFKKYAYIMRSNGIETKVRKTLQQVYNELPEEDFIWVNRGCIINLSQVIRVEADGPVMKNGKKIVIGAEKTAELKKKVRKYWTEDMA